MQNISQEHFIRHGGGWGDGFLGFLENAKHGGWGDGFLGLGRAPPPPPPLRFNLNKYEAWVSKVIFVHLSIYPLQSKKFWGDRVVGDQPRVAKSGVGWSKSTMQRTKGTYTVRTRSIIAKQQHQAKIPSRILSKI